MLLYTEKFERINTKKILSYHLNKNECQFFWENNKSKQIMAGFGCIDAVEIYNDSDLDSIKSKINKKLQSIVDISNDTYIAPKFFGGYAFDVNKKNDDWKNFPRGYFILPECIITSQENHTLITLIKKHDEGLSPQNMSREINDIYINLINKTNKVSNNTSKIDSLNYGATKTDYVHMVNKIIDEIKSNTVQKVVLSRSKYLKFEGSFNLLKCMEQIRNYYPKCINFFIKLPDRGIFFGSTPERLIQKEESLIKSEAIAGTIQRSYNINSDMQLEKQLKNDCKNLEEHHLVIKEIQKKLSPKLINIKISKSPKILKLKNIQHLISNITGELKNDIHILELVKIMHPTPAVAGYPVDKGLKLINKYEQHDRGWYSGPIGWGESSGDGDFCVALRSALIQNQSIQLFSGGGFVLNSNPDKEWEETEFKLETILEIIKDNICYDD